MSRLPWAKALHRAPAGGDALRGLCHSRWKRVPDAWRRSPTGAPRGAASAIRGTPRTARGAVGPDERQHPSRAPSRVYAARPVFRTREGLGSRLFLPGKFDLEQVEDLALGMGEPVERDTVRRVGEPQALEGGEDAAAGGKG